MLRSFEVENCFSFLAPTRLSFTVNKKAPQTRKYAPSCIEEERVTKVTAIFGHNGSGKSNLLRVISFLKWFLIESFGEKPNEDFSLPPFLLKEKPSQTSKIKVEFECKNAIYRYSVEINRSMVVREELESLNLSEKKQTSRRRFKTMFTRVYNKSKDSYDIKSSSDFRINEGLRELVRQRKNASLISAGVFTNHEVSGILKNYWTSVTMKIKRAADRPYLNEFYVMRSTEFYHRHQEFKLKMESMMARSDLGVVGIDIEKVKLPNPGQGEVANQELYMPYGRHRGINGKEYRLPFSLESGGTQQIYVLLSNLLPALDSGGLALIDELEADLHPEVLPVLFDLFESKKTNPKNAQLIFTCHATDLFRVLDKYQVVVVEKDEEGISTAKRLDDLNVRSDDNLHSKYWAGDLGGRPKLIPPTGIKMKDGE